jgi:hypothetical protein
MSSFRLKGAFHRSSHSFTRQWRQRALKHVSLKVLGVALLLLHALFKVIGIICSLAFASLVASSNAIDCVCVVGIIPFCSQELISRSHLWYSKHYIITTKYSLILLVKYFNKKVFTHLAGQVFQQKSIHTSCWSSISTKYSLILGYPTGQVFQQSIHWYWVLFITTKYPLILGSPTGYPFQFCSTAS